MIRTEERVGGACEEDNRTFTFWLTLCVTTLLAALAAFVLSGAFFESSAGAPAHRAAAIVHARS